MQGRLVHAEGACRRRGCEVRAAAGVSVLLATALIGAPASVSAAALVIEKRIPLGDVKGRIDHLALDLKGHRLFVAELGNNSVGVLDLDAGKVINRLSGLAEPQGIAWEPQS